MSGLMTTIVPILLLAILATLFFLTVTRDPDEEQTKIRILGVTTLVYVNVLHQFDVMTVFATIVWSSVSLLIVARTFAGRKS